MSTREIDPRVRIGHAHLKVADVERALAFYCGVLGFALTQRPAGRFVSTGDYHHHIALNTWERQGGSPPARGTTGLCHSQFSIRRVPNWPTVRRVLKAEIPRFSC
jgi:catechol 2,3-dioxygenase